MWEPINLIIENGVIREADEKELKKENQYYRIKWEIAGKDFTIIDYDKNKIRPFIKDYLNRQEMFIEIKLLRIIQIITLLSFLFGIIFFYMTPWKSYIATTMTGETQKIINACQTSIKTALTESKETAPTNNIRPYDKQLTR